MIIGLDLDETLVDTSVVYKKAYKDCGMEDKYEPPLGWSFPNYPENVRKRVYELFKDPVVMTNIPPFPGVPEKIKQLKEDNHTLVVITARHHDIPTIPWVFEMFPEIDLVRVSGYTDSKVSLFKETGIQIWIDDAPHGIEQAKSLGIHTIMVSSEDTPYNHAMRALTPWIEKFTDLEGLY